MSGMSYVGRPAEPRSLMDRITGALCIDGATYRDVARDRTATGQAALVVVLASFAGAIGAVDHHLAGVVAGLIGALVAWVVSSAFIYGVGVLMSPAGTRGVDLGQVMRTEGFAAVPCLLLIFHSIPFFGGLIALVVGVWFILTRLAGIRAALSVTLPRAVVIAIISFILYAVVSAVVGLIFGVSAWMFGWLI